MKMSKALISAIVVAHYTVVALRMEAGDMNGLPLTTAHAGEREEEEWALPLVNLTIRTEDGSKHEISVPENADIIDINRMLWQQGVYVENLLLGSDELDNQSSLIDYSIKEDALLDVRVMDAGILASINDQSLIDAMHAIDESIQGGVDIALKLIGAGAPLDVVDQEKMRTPLHLASLQGSTEIALALIEAGAPVSAIDDWKMTPLHYASRNGHTEIALALIKAGAPLDASDHKKKTPLHYASGNGSTEIALVLIKEGAKLDLVDDYKRSPLRVAFCNGHTEIALALIEADVPWDLGVAPLVIACTTGNTKFASAALIKTHVKLDGVDDYTKMTPLHYASLHGNTDIALALIAAGASLDVVSHSGETALSLANAGGHIECAKALQEAMAEQGRSLQTNRPKSSEDHDSCQACQIM